MTSQLIARVDGLPEVLLDRQRIWPPPAEPRRRSLSANARRRIERQTAGVHECRLPRWARDMVAEQLAERERMEIRSQLARAGLL
jgi:hypothetical protein